MTTQELKITIHGLVNETDDPEILRSIYVLLKKLLATSTDNDVVGYEADGTPISADDLIASALEAEEDIKNGRIVSLREIKAAPGPQ